MEIEIDEDKVQKELEKTIKAFNKLKKFKETLLKAQFNHLDFIKYCWQKNKEDPFVVGYHTYKICKIIDETIKKFEKGESSFIRIKIHHRAGKSDIVSRYLPPHFIGMFPDKEVMAVSYAASLAKGFSRFGRRILNSLKFKDLFPFVTLSAEKKAADDWEMLHKDEKTTGRVYASGLLSGLTGSGYHLGILDDFCKGRSGAESQVQRDNMWDAFVNDFMTRRANVSITIIVATQFNEDDIHGRIEKLNNPKEEQYDPDFPVFEEITFPATVSESEYQYDKDWKKYCNNKKTKEVKKYLFEERYSQEWYRSQYATLGAYNASTMLDCDPIPKGGGMLDCSRLNFLEPDHKFDGELQFIRTWDFAHSVVKKSNKDPDYTGGTLLAFRQIGFNKALNLPICDLFIKHYFQTRETAVKRDNAILSIMAMDGILVQQVVETSLDSIDGFYYLQDRCRSTAKVASLNIGKINKVVRCQPVIPIFEVGNVNVVKGEWNKEWLKGIRSFDGSGKTHDEMVDNITAGYEYQIVRGTRKKLRVRIG